MAKANAKKGGKNRKFGRNKKYCDMYKANGLQEKHHKRAMIRHAKRNPADRRVRSLLRARFGVDVPMPASVALAAFGA